MLCIAVSFYAILIYDQRIWNLLWSILLQYIIANKQLGQFYYNLKCQLISYHWEWTCCVADFAIWHHFYFIFELQNFDLFINFCENVLFELLWQYPDSCIFMTASVQTPTKPNDSSTNLPYSKEICLEVKQSILLNHIGLFAKYLLIILICMCKRAIQPLEIAHQNLSCSPCHRFQMKIIIALKIQAVIQSCPPENFCDNITVPDHDCNAPTK